MGGSLELYPWGEIPRRLAADPCSHPGRSWRPVSLTLQVNGGGGVLLNDQPTADGMRAIARAHRRYGTTACLPTLISDTREQVRSAIAAARARRRPRWGPRRFTWKVRSLAHIVRGVHRPDRVAQGLEAGDLELLCDLAVAGRSTGHAWRPNVFRSDFVRTLVA